jgi:hypothetical protein
MNAPLVLKDFAGEIEITQGAFEWKRKALELARPIAKVETPAQQLQAVAALTELKGLRQGMEQTRKSVKSPVLALGKKIDAAAENFIADVDKQYMRLSGMVSHYQKKQAELRNKEADKIEAEQRDARALRESGAELRSRAMQSTNKEAYDKLVGEALKLEAKAFDLEMNAEVAIVPGIEKPKGLVVRNRITFQVLDAIVFCQAYPQFWKWHADTETLKLDRMRLLDELNKENGLFRMTRFPEELSKSEDRRLVQPAGLRVYEETKSHIR